MARPMTSHTTRDPGLDVETRVLGGHRPGEHKDAGANDGADTESGEIPPPQCPLETVVSGGLGLQCRNPRTPEQIYLRPSRLGGQR